MIWKQYAQRADSLLSFANYIINKRQTSTQIGLVLHYNLQNKLISPKAYLSPYKVCEERFKSEEPDSTLSDDAAGKGSA